MSDLSFEEKAYEIEEIWEKDWFDVKNKNRITEIANLIDKNAESILDVGCGNGMFLEKIISMRDENYFKNEIKLCATDRSHMALNKVNIQVATKQASIDKLPYSDGSFDVVTCLEVIEHLPLEIYTSALKEIFRVAKSNIIIAVPYKEDIKNSLISCKSCHTKFSPDLHMRSFDEKNMSNLFNDKNIKLKKILYIEKNIKYINIILKIIWTFRERPFPSFAICPVCGYNEHEKLKNDLQLRGFKNRKISNFKNIIKFILPKKSIWIIGVYEKNCHN